MSLEQALSNMRARNEALMASDDDIRQRESERAAAKGLRAPLVELDLRYNILNDPVAIRIGRLGVEVQTEYFWKGEATATMPLYAGGRIAAANEAAGARVAEAHAERDRTDDELVTELAQRYFGVCLAKRALEVQQLKVKTMEQQSYRAKRLMEEGIISRAECLNAEVALANARVECDASARDVSIVSEGLSNIVVSDGPIDPSTPLFILRNLEPCEVFQQRVDEGHPVMNLLDAKHHLAEQGVRAEHGERKPTVYLFGMHELVPRDLTLLDPKWAAGVGAKFTLFDGFQARNKVEAARAQEQKVTHLQSKYRRDLKSLVLKRYEEMAKAIEQYDGLESTLELTKENLRVRTRAFEEGLATSLEVVDATLTLARAELGRYKAAYDFDTAFFQLLEASGSTEQLSQYMAKSVAVQEHEWVAALQSSAATTANGIHPTEAKESQ
ncbi:MAG: TolC family protein [Candidatus Hydrogenedentes bacterium]|nr:TolC family protein [Candidatus Hydrogenedentota bacterium]